MDSYIFEREMLWHAFPQIECIYVPTFYCDNCHIFPIDYLKGWWRVWQIRNHSYGMMTWRGGGEMKSDHTIIQWMWHFVPAVFQQFVVTVCVFCRSFTRKNAMVALWEILAWDIWRVLQHSFELRVKHVARCTLVKGAPRRLLSPDLWNLNLNLFHTAGLPIKFQVCKIKSKYE